jgi:glycosyltransferase involved in cell wall biosynthesis
MNILAVIPAYNSEQTIARVIEGTRPQVSGVLVIDDGSTDRTAGAAREAGALVIRIGRNRGKGLALRTGFAAALELGADAVVTLDADLQHEPMEIPKLIQGYIGTGAKMVIGDRLKEKDRIPRMRYAPNRIGTYTFSWLIGQPVQDSQCGFRLYDREVMETIPIWNRGFEAEADLLLRAGKRGYKIVFVPVKAIYFSGRPHRSHYRNVRDTFRISIIFLMNLFWKNR